MEERLPTVAVLMSTYNGEKYLREQLDSIFNQKDVDVRLFVRDDGSKDSTLSIIEDYSKRYPITVLQDKENVGPGESFMRLVNRYANESALEYFAFADQDDIWLEDKLSVAVKSIQDAEYSGPALYCSNQFLYIDGENKGDRHKEIQKTDLISHLTKNTIAGCTFVMNKKLAVLLASKEKPDPRIIKYRLHDAWTMLVAICCGKVIYDETSHMLYRIHSENTVGIRKISAKKRLTKLQRFFVKRDDANLRMITAKQLLKSFPEISDEDEKILILFSNYQKSWKNKMSLAFNKKIRTNCSENPNIFTAKVFINFV